MKIAAVSAALIAGLVPAISHAEEADAGPTAVSATMAIASDYRFRGVSQTNRGMVVQGNLTVPHESGLYAGLWAPNLAGWGTFGGSTWNST